MGSDWHLRLAMGKSGAEMAGFLVVARQKRRVEGVAAPKAWPVVRFNGERRARNASELGGRRAQSPATCESEPNCSL